MNLPTKREDKIKLSGLGKDYFCFSSPDFKTAISTFKGQKISAINLKNVKVFFTKTTFLLHFNLFVKFLPVL